MTNQNSQKKYGLWKQDTPSKKSFCLKSSDFHGTGLLQELFSYMYQNVFDNGPGMSDLGIAWHLRLHCIVFKSLGPIMP